MRHGMGANPIELPRIAKNMGFSFRLRRGRVDWRKIETIDVDQLVQERDLITLYDNLTNVINYNLDNEYDVKVLDPSFVKLFKLAQLSIDYLMFSEQHLCNCLELMQEELQTYLKENEKLKHEIKKKDESIKNIKKKIKDKLSEAYFNFQHFSPSCHTGVFKCSYCPKAFMNSFYLEAHHTRRHSSFPFAAPTASTFTATSVPHIPQACTQEIEQMQTQMQQLKDIVLHQNRENKENIPENLNTKVTQDENMNHEWKEVYDLKMKEWELKYKEEISSLKALLYLEVKNLKEPNHELLELVNSKVKEICTLRQLLEQKASPQDIELHMEAQLAAQENHWMSKISALEAKYKEFINELQQKLLCTQHMAGTAEAEHREKYENMIEVLQSQLSAQDKEIKEQGLLLQQLHMVTPQGKRGSNLEVLQSQLSAQDKEIKEQGLSLQQLHVVTPQAQRGPNLDGTVPSSSPRTTTHTAKVNAWSLSNSTDGDIDTTGYNAATSAVLQATPEKLLNTPSIRPKGETVSVQEAEKKIQHTTSPVCVSKVEKQKTDDTERLYKNCSTQVVQPAEHVTLADPESGQLHKYHSHTPFLVEKKKPLHKPELRPERSLNNLREALHKTEETDEEVGEDEEVEEEDMEEEEDIDEEEEEIDEEEEEENHKRKQNAEIANTKLEEKSSSENVMHSHRASQWPIQSFEEVLALNPEILDELREEVSHVLDRRLHEIGVDPEWQTLPNASYEQKLNMLQHHQNITAKRLKTYFRIKDQLLKEVKARLKAAGEGKKSNKPESEIKNRSLDNLVNTFRKKARTMLKNATRPHTRKSAIPTKQNSFPSPVLLVAKGGMHQSNISDAQSRAPGTSNMSFHIPVQRKPPHRKVPMVQSDSRLSDSSKSTSPVHADFILAPNRKANRLRPSVSEPAINNSLHTNDWPTTSDDEDEADSISGKLASHIPIQSLRPVTDSTKIKLQRRPDNPGNSPMQKSSLKNASSTGNVTKKRVVFPDNNVHYAADSKDVGHDQRSKRTIYEKNLQSKENNLEMSSESDWEEHDEIDGVFEQPDPPQSEAKKINLSTHQSERLAQISKNIEQQLALSRNKPVGGVEAMFTSQSSKDIVKPNQLPVTSSNIVLGSTAPLTHTQKEGIKLVPSEWDIEDLSD